MTTYYVDTASSGGDGTTQNTSGADAAFATIAAMQGKAGGYAAGDSILLKKGCTWREQLVVPSSGSVGSPITFGAYGSGANPVLMASVAKNSTGDWVNNTPPDHIVDGGMEAWTSATNLTSWTEIVNGTSTVSRESTTKRAGSYSCKLLIDAGWDVAGIQQANDLLAATAYTIGIWHQETGTATLEFVLKNETSGQYLQSDGSWGGYAAIIMTHAATWTQYTFNFTSTTAALYTLVIEASGDRGDQSYYIDGVSLTEAANANIWCASDALFANDVGAISSVSNLILPNKKQTYAELTTQGDYYSFQSGSKLYLYSASNPATYYNGLLECWYATTGQVDIVWGLGKNYITFENIDLKYGGGNGIELRNCTNWIIQNLDISYIGGFYWTPGVQGGVGIQINEGCSDIAVTGYTSTETCNSPVAIENANSESDSSAISFTNCTFNKAAQAGIEVANISTGKSISNVSFTNVTITNTGLGSWGVILGDPDSWGIHIYGPNELGTISDVTFTQCYIYGNQGHGVEVSDGGGVTTISRSAIYDNGGDAVRITGYSNPSSVGIILEYNLIYNNTKNGLYYSNAYGQGITLYNNTFYNNGTDGDGTYTVNVINRSATNAIKNNIFYGVNSVAFYDTYGLNGGATINYNEYYRASGNLIRYIGTTYTTAQFATYKTDSSQDANSINTDPKFQVNGVDFRLQSSSPCIDAGVDVGLTQDYAGNPVPRV